ncbi:MAG: hypothetical protein KAI50_02690 [Desulfobacterales bacterium]|nr:hypothetical protein [Desulfobacterales bacterium]
MKQSALAIPPKHLAKKQNPWPQAMTKGLKKDLKDGKTYQLIENKTSSKFRFVAGLEGWRNG